MNPLLKVLVVITLCVFGPGTAGAHSSSTGYLWIELAAESQGRGRLDLSVRDVARLGNVDADRDRRVTWGEIRTSYPQIVALIGNSLRFEQAVGEHNQSACHIRPNPPQLADRLAQTYLVVAFQFSCDPASPIQRLRYQPPTELGARHRLLVHIETEHAQIPTVLSSTNQAVQLANPSALDEFTAYWYEGVIHLFAGADHILFLLTLLLTFSRPVRRPKGAIDTPSMRSVTFRCLALATAFTIAHSITLSLAALDLFTMPPRSIEIAIAASVLLAALNCLCRLLDDKVIALAFGLGLLHGFGFANVFGELGSTPDSVVFPLFAFNLGVESAQVAIVLLALPAIALLRQHPRIAHAVVISSATVVGAIATSWIWERALV